MDNAFERARAAYGTGAYDDATLEFLFPQLKESEDERIMKAILGLTYLDGIEPILTKCSITAGDIRTYLEKQKENIEREYVFRPLAGTDITVAAEQAIRRANEGDRLVLAFNGAYIPVRKGCNANKIVDIYDAFIEKQKEQPQEELVYRLNGLMQEYIKEGKDEAEKEHRFKCYHLFWDALEDADFFEQKEQKDQKPAEWSEDDKDAITQAIIALEDMYDEDMPNTCYAGCKLPFNKAAERLKSLRPQQKVEWSEEDDLMRTVIIMTLETFGGRGTTEMQIDWLKALPERFSYQTK